MTTRNALAVSMLGLLATAASAQDPATIERPEIGAFAFEHVLVLPGSPEQIFDAATGDISGWWDHSYSGNPARFVLEPWPGGRFLEVFQEGSRDGVIHATVTYARRGEWFTNRGQKKTFF